MRLGLNLGYWSTTDDAALLDLAPAAERLGYAMVWVAEAYGSDAVSVLGHLSARTQHIGLGAAVLQIPARTPAATAMAAATLDVLSDGRLTLGLGVSGPQVSEGWHGVRFDHPLERTREYVHLVRRALARGVVESPGPHYPLPLPDGPGKALRMSIRPPRAALPVYLGAVGPRNLRLTGEIADGWLGLFFSPEHAELALGPLRDGRRLALGADTTVAEADLLQGFDVAPTVSVSVGDDLEAAADRLRPQAALYLGGMGSRERNFYHASAVRMGFGEGADEVQRLFLEGRPRDAAAAVPADFLHATGIAGPVDVVRRRLRAHAEAGVTTLSINPIGATPDERMHVVRTVAEAARAEGLIA